MRRRHPIDFDGCRPSQSGLGPPSYPSIQRRYFAMPTPVPDPPTADRNLLFGILALQMDFIDRDQLIAAMHAWVLDKQTSLGEILLRQGALRGDTFPLLDAL